MAEEPNPSNPNNIEMNLTAHDKSQVTQVGQLNAAEVKIFVKRIEPILERWQQIPKVESPGVLKAGNSPKRLTSWQGRKTEIAQINQWLTDENTFLIGIEGIGSTGKSMLAAKFERLSELQKALLLNISVYRGAVDSTATVAVLPGSYETEIEQELRNLVKRSLLLEKLNGKRWYEFQPVVLEYARYKAGIQTEAHQRAINYYLLNVKQQAWQTKEDIKEYLEIFYHWYSNGQGS